MWDHKVTDKSGQLHRWQAGKDRFSVALHFSLLREKPAHQAPGATLFGTDDRGAKRDRMGLINLAEKF